MRELSTGQAPEAATQAEAPKGAERGASEAEPASDAPPPPALKILLAEDNGVNRMVLEKILSRARHEVTVVTDGEAALETMLSGSFDVILLDVNMPGISGPEAAWLYRCALPPEAQAPIVALTADASAACREQCEEAGVTGFLTKPVTPETLLEAVARAARAKREPGGQERQDQERHDQGRRYQKPRGRPDAPISGDDILDPAALTSLTALGGETFLRGLMLQFIGEGSEIVERMTIAIEEGDLFAFQREAHALASSAGNIGAPGLARLCRSWRDVEPGPFALYGDDFLDDLRHEWTRVATALNGKLIPSENARISDPHPPANVRNWRREA